MSRRATLPHQPALDGVRAIAVVTVLLFHADTPGFGGGYLGVSVFFTLSGFLITNLLLHELETTGTIDLAGFYGRRMRRLLPASVLCLAAVTVIAATTDAFSGVETLRTHVLGAVLQVANWVFLAGDGSYQHLLAESAGAVSPVEHFWSLAIEEQFYLVWPVVLLVLARRTTGRRQLVRAVVVATAIAVAVAPLVAAVWGADAAYWATPARFGEIMIGAALAALLRGRRIAPGVAAAAPVAMVTLAVCVVLFPTSGGPAYDGWLPAVGVVSAALILGLQTDGPVRRTLSRRPLVGIGRISYGLYLFHWPVFVLLDPVRLGWPAPAVFVLRMAVTVVVAVASFVAVEQPIRRSAGRRVLPTFAGAATATATVAVVAFVTVAAPSGEYWELDAAAAAAAAIDVVDGPPAPITPITPSTTWSEPRAASSGASSQGPAGSTRARSVGMAVDRGASSVGSVPDVEVPDVEVPDVEVSDVEVSDVEVSDVEVPDVEVPDVEVLDVEVRPVPPVPSRPLRVVVTGDSTAKALGAGLVGWATARPDLAQVEVAGAAGCGLLEPGERQIGGRIDEDGCAGWLDDQLYPRIERLRPDVVVAMVTAWDVVDRRWDGGDLLDPFDDEYVRRLDHDYAGVIDRLRDLGVAHVVFVRHPIPNPYWLPTTDVGEDPARHAVVYDLYDRLALDPDVHVVALDRWMWSSGLDTDEEVRPDGVHLAPDAATAIGADYLGEQLLWIGLELPRP